MKNHRRCHRAFTKKRSRSVATERQARWMCGSFLYITCEISGLSPLLRKQDMRAIVLAGLPPRILIHRQICPASTVARPFYWTSVWNSDVSDPVNALVAIKNERHARQKCAVNERPVDETSLSVESGLVNSVTSLSEVRRHRKAPVGKWTPLFAIKWQILATTKWGC
jgi:hypothetical protein